MNKSIDNMKTCIDCHFLEQDEFGKLPRKKRESLKANGLQLWIEEFKDERPGNVFKCSRDVWHENKLRIHYIDEQRRYGKTITNDEITLNPKLREEIILDYLNRNRAENCFFYPYTPTLRDNEAFILENRKWEMDQSDKDRDFTRISLGLAKTSLDETVKSNKTSRIIAILAIVALLLNIFFIEGLLSTTAATLIIFVCYFLLKKRNTAIF